MVGLCAETEIWLKGKMAASQRQKPKPGGVIQEAVEAVRLKAAGGKFKPPPLQSARTAPAEKLLSAISGAPLVHQRTL